MRLMFMSNSGWSPQGYGVQVKGLVPKLIEMGHDVAVFAFYGLEGGKVDLPIDGHVDHESGEASEVVVTHYPRLLDPYGNDAIDGHMADFEADAVITLLDTWVLDPTRFQKHNWLAWMPVDQDPIPEPVLARLPFMKRALPYSRFGERLIQATKVPCSYVPHGVDSQTFRPFPEEGRRGAKQALGFEPDDFVVGMVGANKGFPSRKGFPEAFLAFAKLRESVPEARLYVHSHITSAYGGPDLQHLAEACGIASYVRFSNQYQMAIGAIPPEAMAIAYNAMDTLLMASTNEGFGLPIIEAQACGTPVIATDNTSMSELVSESGWLCKPIQNQLSSQMSWIAVPSVDEMTFALQNLHWQLQDPDARRRIRDETREFALPFDWQNVADNYWRPLLDQVAEEIGAETSTPTPVYVPVAPTPEQLERREAAAATAATMDRTAELIGVKLSGLDLGELESFHDTGPPVKFVVPPPESGLIYSHEDRMEALVGHD